MEDIQCQIIATKWCIVEQRMVQQQVQTPQGVQIVQQPIQVPIVFRDLAEVQRYIKEVYKGEQNQIVLQKIEYELGQESQIEFYYK